jgi:phosphoglycerate dehydrogenase-like enzyme
MDERALSLVCLSPLPAEMVAGSLPPELDISVTVERSGPALTSVLRTADLVLGDFTGEVKVTEEVVAVMEAVRLFHQPTTGYESVDVDACARRGIPVTNAGRVTSVAMAEHTVMVTLALLKSLTWCDAEVRAGRWPQHEVVGRSLVELAGKTVGLVGLGGAGAETARRLAPFGCEVLYTARRRRAPEVERELGVRWATIDELLAAADVVCLLVDLNESTSHLIDGAALDRMKSHAVLVNPARGGVVDEEALVRALRDGSIAGAALDVFADEPLRTGSPLRELDNVLLTPHVGGATLEARMRILDRSWDVIVRAARGELPDGVVNGVGALRHP